MFDDRAVAHTLVTLEDKTPNETVDALRRIRGTCFWTGRVKRLCGRKTMRHDALFSL